MRVRQGGSGDPVLLLLHGLGGTAEVWNAVTAELDGSWPCRWVAPDLPGHGGSAPLPSYSFGHLAAAVSECVPATDRLVVLGHSLGGVVGLTLATGWFGVRVRAACGVGIKIDWTPDDLAKAAHLAGRPVRVFPSRDEAADRYLRVAGLDGLTAPDSADVEPGLRAVDGGWRLAMDPQVFGVGAPDLPGLLAATRATEVVLAAGQHDSMCRPEDVRAVGLEPVILPGLGHSVHVEDPAAISPLLERLLAAPS